jgi:hypothetical protein
VATSNVSRYLLEKTNTQVIFTHNGKALDILAARLKLGNRPNHALKLMLAGGAIVRREDGTLESFNPLPCDYIARQSRLTSRRNNSEAEIFDEAGARESNLGEDVTPLLQAPTTIHDFFSSSSNSNRVGA